MLEMAVEPGVRTGRAFVLGGGGPVGRAWQAGIAAGLLAQGVALRDADLILGTSAGAIVGAHVALGLTPDLALPAADAAALLARPPGPPAGMQAMMTAMTRATTSATPEVERERIGHMALAAPTISEADSLARAMLAALVGRRWPAIFKATSLSTRTGRLRVWDADANVPLERAVAASSALPGMWPPITIGDDRYMDGGIRSTLNADLAAGFSRVLVLSCFHLGADALGALHKAPLAEIARLRSGGSAVEIVAPDAAFRDLTGNGMRMLDGRLGPEAYAIGRGQASEGIDTVRRAWESA